MINLDENNLIVNDGENVISLEPVEETDEVGDEGSDGIQPDGNRQHTDILLNSFDKNFNSFNEKPIILEDWSEAVSGWKPLPPYPKYTVGARKRKPTENSELHCVVRCVDDDDSDHYLKWWRAAVEPLTFRYIPNNAHYRLVKFSQIGEDWYTIRKNKLEKVTICETDLIKITRESRSKTRGPRKKPDKRSRSTNSDSALTRRTPKITNIQAHQKSQLSKSVTDIFMDNLDSKLNQLENRVKTHVQNNKFKHTGDNQSDSETESNLLFRKNKATSVTFNNQVDCFADSANENCSVTSSTASKNLRPLEKVTPKQRYKLGINKSLPTSQESKSFGDASYLNFRSSVALEAVESEQLRKIDYSDSYLLRKGDNVQSTKQSPLSSAVKKKNAILKYTTANLKSKDKLWEPPAVDGNDLVSGIVGELPEVSGKQIPVTFTTHRLLRQ